MDGFSYAVSRRELVEIIDAMSTEHCRAMHIAARQGDLATAQSLLRKATEQYFAATPAAPAIAPTVSRRCVRRAQHSKHPSRY
jgi:hypothetical protein